MAGTEYGAQRLSRLFRRGPRGLVAAALRPRLARVLHVRLTPRRDFESVNSFNWSAVQANLKAYAKIAGYENEKAAHCEGIVAARHSSPRDASGVTA
jgi:hypothetical protein